MRPARQRHGRRRAQPGFALPSVLFVTAMVTLVFLVAIQALASLASETRRVKTRVAFEASALSLEARTTFITATRPLGPAAATGAGAAAAPPLALDGRPYAAGLDLTLAAQDEAGLINLDNLPTPARARLFAAMGVSPAYQAAMADRLGDYMDVADLKRPQGADAADYARAGLPAPPQGPLVRRAQALGLLGWDAAVGPQRWRDFADNVTADPSSSDVNVNTAPAATLEVLYGLTPAQAEAAVARREGAPFTELEDLGRAVGLKLLSDAERSYTMPNGRLALKVEDADAGFAYRSRLILSPDDPARPFWVAEPVISQLSPAERAQVPAHAPQFPDPLD
jgi:DNA uptake protein ComE-like DNA-binding protein